jgi:DNA-directed RNA polymerase alpha subunit/superfamily II DNA or RNA helicase/ribosomal protein S17E
MSLFKPLATFTPSFMPSFTLPMGTDVEFHHHAGTATKPEKVALLDTYSTRNTAFISDRDKPGRISSRLFDRKERKPKALVTSAPKQPDPETTAIKNALNQEIALELTHMLLETVVDEGKIRVQRRTKTTSDRLETIQLEQQSALLEQACDAASKKLATPEALTDRRVRLSIIRGIFNYIKTYPTLARKYAPIVNPLARFLNIGDGDYIRTRRKAAKAKMPTPAHHIEPTRTPLENFLGKTWEEICTLCGFEPRPYQEAWYEGLLMRASKEHDRAFLGAPTQVGKTYSFLPLATALASSCYPKKTILIVVPEQSVIDAILKDLKKAKTTLKIGRIDSKHKDFGPGYDIVVASLWTLGREKNLKELNPELYGVIATDEAKRLFTPTGKRLLQELGFLDSNHKITPNPDKFLFGFSADASHFPFDTIFGHNARVDKFDLPWYVNNNFLHEPIGVHSEYKRAAGIDDWEVITERGEVYAYPKDKKKCIAEIYEDYKRLFKSKKVVIAWPSIVHAEAAAAYFNFREGNEDFSFAHHSQNTRDKNRAAEEGFQEGTGPTILHGVKALSIGFRAKGAQGIIFPYQTLSYSLYGQWIGRILGIHDKEPQRQVTVLQKMGWNGQGMRKAMTLARLMGIDNYPGDNVEYRPLRILAQGGGKKPPPVKFTIQLTSQNPLSLNFVPVESSENIIVYPQRFPTLLRDHCDDNFEGNLQTMAEGTKIPSKDLENYISGHMPKKIKTVYQLATTFFPENPTRLINAWIEDFLDLMEAGYKMRTWQKGSAVYELITTLRRVSLFAQHHEDKTTHFPSKLTLTPEETTGLGRLIRGDLLSYSGLLRIKEWRDLAHRILMSDAHIDEELVADLLERAAKEITTEASTLATKWEQQKKTGSTAKYTEDDELNAKFPDIGPLTTRQKLTLYKHLNTVVRAKSRLFAATQKTRQEFVDTITQIVKKRFGKKQALLGDLLQIPEEEIFAHPYFRRRQSKLKSFYEKLKTHYGLRPGMNLHAWEPHEEPSEKEISALHDKLNQPLEALSLDERINDILKSKGFVYVGDLLTRPLPLHKPRTGSWRLASIDSGLDPSFLDPSDSHQIDNALSHFYDLSTTMDTADWQLERQISKKEIQQIIDKVNSGKSTWWHELHPHYPILLDEIYDLELSVNTENRLEGAHILYIYELVAKTENDLLKIKYLGRKMLNDIKDALAEKGLQLGMKDPHVWQGYLRTALGSKEPTKPAPVTKEPIEPSPVTREELNERLFCEINEFDFMSRTIKLLTKYHGYTYAWELTELTEDELLKLRGFGGKALRDLKEILSENGIALGWDLSEYKHLLPPKKPAPEKQPLTGSRLEEKHEIMSKPIDFLGTYSRLTAKRLKKAGIDYVWQLVRESRQSLYITHKLFMDDIEFYITRLTQHGLSLNMSFESTGFPNSQMDSGGVLETHRGGILMYD